MKKTKINCYFLCLFLATFSLLQAQNTDPFFDITKFPIPSDPTFIEKKVDYNSHSLQKINSFYEQQDIWHLRAFYENKRNIFKNDTTIAIATSDKNELVLFDNKKVVFRQLAEHKIQCDQSKISNLITTYPIASMQRKLLNVLRHGLTFSKTDTLLTIKDKQGNRIEFAKRNGRSLRYYPDENYQLVALQKGNQKRTIPIPHAGLPKIRLVKGGYIYGVNPRADWLNAFINVKNDSTATISYLGRSDYSCCGAYPHFYLQNVYPKPSFFGTHRISQPHRDSLFLINLKNNIKLTFVTRSRINTFLAQKNQRPQYDISPNLLDYFDKMLGKYEILEKSSEEKKNVILKKVLDCYTFDAQQNGFIRYVKYGFYEKEKLLTAFCITATKNKEKAMFLFITYEHLGFRVDVACKKGKLYQLSEVETYLSKYKIFSEEGDSTFFLPKKATQFVMRENTDLEVAEHFSNKFYEKYIEFKGKRINGFGTYGHREYLLRKK